MGEQRKRFLHVGCGPARQQNTTALFAGEDWEETRFDIAESAEPDILGTMTDMSAIPHGSFDGIFSSHNIEHLYAHEVPMALKEFLRVLKSDGYAVITCPDLQSIALLVAQDRLVHTAYYCALGPITPLDVIYGYRKELAAGNHYMAHKCGFTQSVLKDSLRLAGFANVVTTARGDPYFDIWALASACERSREELTELAFAHFPSGDA